MILPRVLMETALGVPGLTDMEICGSGILEIAPEGAEGAVFRFYTEKDRTLPVYEGTSYFAQIDGQTTFYVSQVVENCEGPQQSMEIHYYTKPNSPAVEEVAYCGENDIDLIATGGGIGGEYKWYASAEATEVLARGHHFSYENLTGTTSFYVSYTSAKGCESERTKATASIHQIPAAPKVADEYSCNGSTSVVLYIQNPIPGYEYQWFNDKETLLKTGLTFQSGAISETTTYKIKAISSNKCQSSMATARAVLLADEPVDIGSDEILCKWGESYNLNQELSESLKGGIFTGSGVFNDTLFIPSAVEAGTYEVQYTLRKGNCKAFGSRKITVSVGTGEQKLALNNGILQVCENTNPISLDAFVYDDYIASSQWSGPGVASNVFDPTGLAPGIYDLDYAVEVNGCWYETVQKIEIIKTFSAKPRVSGTFLEVCEDEMVSLSASFSETNKNIHWYNDQNEKIGEGTTLEFRAKKSELIYCRGVDQKACESAPTIISVNVYEFPDSIQSSATKVKAHEAITFDVFEPADKEHTYLWDFGDGQSSTQKSPAIFYYEEGRFEVELILSNLKKGCSDTLNQIIKVEGIADTTITSSNTYPLSQDINIFPNPFQERLMITISDNSILKKQKNSPNIGNIAIYDLLGREPVGKEDITYDGKNIIISTKDIPRGIYLLKINSRIFKLSKS